MRNTKSLLSLLSLLIVMSVILFNCKKDEEEEDKSPPITGCTNSDCYFQPGTFTHSIPDSIFWEAPMTNFNNWDETFVIISVDGIVIDTLDTSFEFEYQSTVGSCTYKHLEISWENQGCHDGGYCIHASVWMVFPNDTLSFIPNDFIGTYSLGNIEPCYGIDTVKLTIAGDKYLADISDVNTNYFEIVDIKYIKDHNLKKKYKVLGRCYGEFTNVNNSSDVKHVSFLFSNKYLEIDYN